jgi:ribose/xylose/arabinose/galactoside ABC-type transport system permease subunit
MTELTQKTAEKQQSSHLHYYNDLIWRLLAEVPWLVITLVLVMIMFLRLNLISAGAVRMDQVVRNAIPITMIMGFLFIPMVIIVASGDVDLSLGFLAGVVGWIVAILSPKMGLGLAIIISLLIALAVGLINGLLVGLVKLKGIVVTFAIDRKSVV